MACPKGSGGSARKDLGERKILKEEKEILGEEVLTTRKGRKRKIEVFRETMRTKQSTWIYKCPLSPTGHWAAYCLLSGV